MVGDHLVQPIIACIGFPIAGNPMQFVTERTMHIMELDRCVMTTAVTAEKLEGAMVGVRAMRFAGLAVLAPHQRDIVKYLDHLSPAANLSQVVQIAKRVEETWTGEDLRGEAVIQLLRDRKFETGGKNLLVLGNSALDKILPLADPLLDGHVFTVESWIAKQEDAPKLPMPSQHGDSSSEVSMRLDGEEGPQAGNNQAPSSNPQESADRIPEGESRPTFIDVVCAFHENHSPEESRVSKLPLAEKGIVIVQDRDHYDIWKKWSGDRGWECASPIEYQSELIASMIRSWTQTQPPIAVVRELLDEYLEW